VTAQHVDAATDADLITRFRGGEEAAFGELVARHERRVYNLAYRMLGRAEDARDATQDAFVSCYRNLAKFRGDAAFGTWLHRIAVNSCYDLLRKRPPDPVELTEASAGPGPEDVAEQAAASLDVQRALLSVPEEFRAVLILHDIQAMPYEDIAAALDVPIGTVKSRLHRGRVALGQALGMTRTRATRGEPRPRRTPSKGSAPKPASTRKAKAMTQPTKDMDQR
jgi:RNA polymerase sigma-70 factor, ECF subfamily